MAWSSPKTWNVGDILPAAELNTYVRDNLNYLKGNAGAVAIGDAMSLSLTTAAAAGLTVTNSSANSAAMTGVVMLNDGATIAGLYRCSSANTAYAGANSLNLLTVGAHPFGFSTANALRMIIDGSGNIGLGTSSPQSVLHAKQPSAGGFMFLSASAVAGSVVTLAAAGTVTTMAGFWGFDRNNTGAGLVQVSGNMLTLGGTFGFSNTDTVTVTLTAGGGITVQRTAGTNGTHEVNLLVMYK